MYSPAAICVTPDNPDTFAHVDRSVLDPSPNCPYVLLPLVHTEPSANNTTTHGVTGLLTLPDHTAFTTGEGNTRSDCANDDEYPTPATTTFEPNTENDSDFASDPETAVTLTDDPGFAHGVPRSICVTAFPEPSVVADAGLNDAPKGPENDTAAPATAAPDAFLSAAVTGEAPDAATCIEGADKLRAPLDTANAGDTDNIITAGTEKAAPATTVRRLRPGSAVT